MSIVHYDRTFEQNEQLGLNDMKTENYGEEDAAAAITEATPLQQAHLLEVGASAQRHLYTRDDAKNTENNTPSLLTPNHAAAGGSESRRVSSGARSVAGKSSSSSADGADGS